MRQSAIHLKSMYYTLRHLLLQHVFPTPTHALMFHVAISELLHYTPYDIVSGGRETNTSLTQVRHTDEVKMKLFQPGDAIRKGSLATNLDISNVKKGLSATTSKVTAIQSVCCQPLSDSPFLICLSVRVH